MKKVLVLGSAGMAGHMIYTKIKELGKYDLIGTYNKNRFEDAAVKLDISDQVKVKEVINDIRPDVVINCVGVLIRGSSRSSAKAIYANSFLPHMLADLCDSIGAKLIHISTDCVFSGEKGNYTEISVKDANDIYGKSKGLGEIVNEKDLTIRTSIIGPELNANGEGLFDWFMSQQVKVNGFKSAFWSGVTTLELAKFIIWNLEKNLTGLVHLTNGTPINKFELLTLINDIYDRKLLITADSDYCVNKSFVNTNEQVSYKVPTYDEMLKEQHDFMLSRSGLYRHYDL